MDLERVTVARRGAGRCRRGLARRRRRDGALHWSVRYDDDADRVVQTDPRSMVTVDRFDLRGRVVDESFTAATNPNVAQLRGVRYAWDGNDNPELITAVKAVPGGTTVEEVTDPTYDRLDPLDRSSFCCPYINYSQRTVSQNVDLYTADMQAGRWNWARSGPLRVIERDGQLASYDNRRLLAAQTAGLERVPIQVVEEHAPAHGGARTWGEPFDARLNDPRNVAASGPAPIPASRPSRTCFGGGT